MNKLVLGTAQFGLNYGVSNQRGIIPSKEVETILKLAAQKGISTLDTASIYGQSESLIGQIATQHNLNFNIISKLPVENVDNVETHLNQTLANLRQKQLFGYLFHHFGNYAKNPQLLNQLIRLRQSGKVKKIGFSLNFVEELDFLLRRKIDFDLLQIPYNVLDQRFDSYLPNLKKMGKEIYARSVFLQGLFFKPLESLKGKFMKIVPNLLDLRLIAQESELSMVEVCLHFCLNHPFLDKVIIGVESLDNLYQNIQCAKSKNAIQSIRPALKQLAIDDERVILPLNWR